MAGSKRLRLRARIELNKINPYVLIGAAHAARLQPGWRKPMPVRIQVNGKPSAGWRINMMPVGDGSFFLYLHAEIRKASNTGVGDIVMVTLQFDEEYRSGPVDPMPRALSAGLRTNPVARKAWSKLPPSRQKEILRYLNRLKSPEALRRNVVKAIRVLAGTRARFMARPWSNGR